MVEHGTGFEADSVALSLSTPKGKRRKVTIYFRRQPGCVSMYFDKRSHDLTDDDDAIPRIFFSKTRATLCLATS